MNKQKKMLFWFWVIFAVLFVVPFIIALTVNDCDLAHRMIDSLINGSPREPISPEVIARHEAMAKEWGGVATVIFIMFVGLLSVFIDGMGAVIVTRTAQGKPVYGKGTTSEALNYGIAMSILKDTLKK